VVQRELLEGRAPQVDDVETLDRMLLSGELTEDPTLATPNI
jgi:hypothetical protein